MAREPIADESRRPPPLVEFPLQDETPGALIYRPPDITPPSPAHDPAPTFKRSIWILRLIFLATLIAVIIGLYMI